MNPTMDLAPKNMERPAPATPPAPQCFACGGTETTRYYKGLPLCEQHKDHLPFGPKDPTWEPVPPYVQVRCGKCQHPTYAMQFVDFDPEKHDGTHIPHRPECWIVQPHGPPPGQPLGFSQGRCDAYEAKYLDPRVKGPLHLAVPQETPP